LTAKAHPFKFKISSTSVLNKGVWLSRRRLGRDILLGILPWQIRGVLKTGWLRRTWLLGAGEDHFERNLNASNIFERNFH
jgi:hypothetical protein